MPGKGILLSGEKLEPATIVLFFLIFSVSDCCKYLLREIFLIRKLNFTSLSVMSCDSEKES